VKGVSSASSASAAPTPPKGRTVDRRPICGLLFSDLKGFSALHDEQLFGFIDGPLKAMAHVIKGHGDAILRRATWGDAIFIAARDVVTTASCALGLQEALTQTDMAAYGLPDGLQMRIAVHIGPIVWAYDPILDEADAFGRELTRAARIEPRTPPGEVYATSAFAALLAMDPSTTIVPEYVGRLTTAKDFETIPMYVLKRHGAPAL
jgi:adenylate cyclase